MPDIHSLTQGIISSYEVRVAGIASIREAAQLVCQATQLELSELNAAHQAMAHQQRADLAKERANLAQGETRRKSGVNAWMKDVATAHAAAHDEWQKLAAAMQAKRGVPAAQRKAGAEASPAFGDLRDKVFAYLADHPDGARMTELEKEFGVARIQMARVIRHLTDENKVAKRDLVYFAI